MPITHILFDMNGVLCQYDKPKRVAHLARLTHLSAEAVDAAIWGSGFEDAGDAGLMSGSHYLKGFGEALAYPLSLGEWTEAQKRAMTPDPAMLALVRGLRGKCRIAVLTNNNLLIRDQMPVLFPELGEIFGEAVHVSAEFGARKPEPECYLGCVEALGARPEETLFVDDNLANVEGAREAGLIAHHFRDQPGLEALLATLL